MRGFIKKPLLLLSLACWGVCAQAPDEIWRRRERLQKEDLGRVTAWFRKKNESLSKFYVYDKRAVHNDYSVIAVTGFDDKRPPPRDPWFGIFAVYGRTNRVYMVLDVSLAPPCCGPRLGNATGELVYVDWFGDYGFYAGTHKYVYSSAQSSTNPTARRGSFPSITSNVSIAIFASCSPYIA